MTPPADQSAAGPKITSAIRQALAWFARNEPVTVFDRTGPSPIILKRLREYGLIECIGTTYTSCGGPFAQHARTAAGRRLT